MQRLQDEKFQPGASVDAKKPASGKAAKVKVVKKPSGGARKHDPNAKNVRCERARASGKFTRWGTRVLKWEVEK